ncbi:Imm61 family immunity protein [Candidatus Mycolicibacterium alkanivorans]|uniref:TNT antitoxin family protein n=1 Tax=Candidatus Mycolicibacterium alkanivorans TaxID=2954114 RepID=A0ABS9Z0D8_9MYCO|nr:Imm61 family immunity protein [Candidatus Mycolicibacterium alkanivorans]MCI4676802.1 TNT antitoxin family protein [Candidatus Mycolicibacterium alkanivorans]
MRSEIGVTSQFELWAEKAGYSVTESSSEDGRAIVWNSGGEIRYFIGKGAEEWIVVTSSERMGKEEFVLASPLPDLIERKFLAIFARLVRSHSGLVRLSRPTSTAHLAAGYSVGVQHFWGKDRRTLIDSQGRVIAVVSGGELVGTVNAVELSLFASHTSDAIVQSMMDPAGKPLFSVRNG